MTTIFNKQNEMILSAENNFIPGSFEYTKKNDKIMYSNAWQAITLTDTWDFVRECKTSFVLSNDPKIWIISDKMNELGYNGHSGCSFGFTMQTMHFIANNGEEKYKEIYLKNKKI